MTALKRDISTVGLLLQKNPYDASLKTKYMQKKKLHKRQVKKINKQFKEKILDKIAGLETANPKKYWQLINTVRSKRKQGKTLDTNAFLDHFKSLNSKSILNTPKKLDSKFEEKILNELKQLQSSDIQSPILDSVITMDEVDTAIKGLTGGKATGLDTISNDMIKAGRSCLTEPLTYLFNLIISISIFPKQWCEGMIICLHKNGDKSEPKNYRGLTLSSCLGKILTKILSKRFLNFLQTNKIIPENQIGFTENYRTTDNIFLLYTIIQAYKAAKKHVYACFVDFSKAFDSVWREGLLYKLYRNNISTMFCKLLTNMYSKLNSAVKVSDIHVTESFISEVGTRQGCHLSPLIFITFISDLVNVFEKFSCNPITLNDQKISVLLFADDIVLLSDKASGLQRAMNLLEQYCKKWKLTVNLDKTKVLIFNSNPKKNNFNFYFDRKLVETVNKYCYLGVIFTSSNSFKQCIENLQAKANKAYYALINSINVNYCKNIKLLSKLYDSLVMPIQLYGSEVWFLPSLKNKVLKHSNWVERILSNSNMYDKLHLRFCRYLLHVNKYTERNSLFAELGRYPIAVYSFTRFVKYCFRLSMSTDKTMLYKAYKVSDSLDFGSIAVYNKLINVLPPNVSSNGDLTQNLKANIKQMGKSIQSYIKEKYAKICINNIQSNEGKLRLYKQIKHNFCTEKYLLDDLAPTVRQAISKIRLSAHKLPIELGRKQSIALNLRTCKICQTGQVGDEFHVFMACPNPTIYSSRSNFLTKIGQLIHQFKTLDTQNQWILLLNCTDHEIIKMFGSFISSTLSKYYDISKCNQPT